MHLSFTYGLYGRIVLCCCAVVDLVCTVRKNFYIEPKIYFHAKKMDKKVFYGKQYRYVCILPAHMPDENESLSRSIWCAKNEIWIYFLMNKNWIIIWHFFWERKYAQTIFDDFFPPFFWKTEKRIFLKIFKNDEHFWIRYVRKINRFPQCVECGLLGAKVAHVRGTLYVPSEVKLYIHT